MNDKPKVLISTLAMTKINYWVQASNDEISGLGKCTYDRDKMQFLVTDVYLLEQENGPTTTDIDASAVAKLLYETREVEGHLNFWWHSHVNMSVFWSGTDKSTIKEFGEQGFCLATVFNKKREMRSALYRGGDDFAPSVFIDELPTEQYTPIDESILKACKEEMDAKCKKKSYSYNGGYYTGGKGKGKSGKGKTGPKNKNQTNKTSGIGGDVCSRDKLGFEFQGTDFQYDRLAKKEYSYAGFPFKSVINPQFRDHGSIHPTNYSVWDNNDSKWLPIHLWVAQNPEDAYAVIYKAPFSSADFLRMCNVYSMIFKNPPMELADIEEFFCDFMDLDVQAFWRTGIEHITAIHTDFDQTIQALAGYHAMNHTKGA